jgi:hypothetical protein
MAQERSMPGDWENLKCDCGGERFAETRSLRWRPTGGTTPQHAGYKCALCGLEVDTGYLIRKAEVAHKKQQLKEAQDELASLETPTAAAAKK